MKRIYAKSSRILLIRVLLIFVFVLVYFFAREELIGLAFGMIVYVLYDLLFFIRSVEFDDVQLILHFYTRKKVIPYTRVRMAEKASWNSYKVVTLFLDDGAIDILSGFVYTKDDISKVINETNKRCRSDKR